MFMPRNMTRGMHVLLLTSHSESGVSRRFGSHVPVVKGCLLASSVSSLQTKTRRDPRNKTDSPASCRLLSHHTPTLLCHSAFLACSFSPGAVPSVVTFPFSISAAHRAAPTVFVNANRILAIGTNSSRTAATPKLTHTYQHMFRIPKPLHWCLLVVTYLVYAALYSSMCFCF